MAGLEDKLSGILSDPEAVSKLRSLGAALGLDTSGTGYQPSSAAKSPAAVSYSGNGSSDELASTLMRLAPMLSDMGRDDDVSCLLNSLRPFLSEQRRARLDQAGKMLRVMKLLPIIKESGFM